MISENQGYTKPTKIRQAFTIVEDATLQSLVQQFGENNNWSTIAQFMPNRNARQCRDRWRGYLRPSLSTKTWTEEEDRILIQKYTEFGPRWTIIGKFIPSRSEVAIKSRWKLLTTYCSSNSNANNLNSNSNNNSDQTSVASSDSENNEIFPLAVYFNNRKKEFSANMPQEEQLEEQKNTKFEPLSSNYFCQLEKRGKLEELFNTLNLEALPN